MSRYLSADACAGQLRDARNVIMDQIPVLAPQLTDDPMAIHTALRGQIIAQGEVDSRQFVDPDRIHPVGLNKAARNAMIGYLIGEQTTHLVDGQGADARFVPHKDDFRPRSDDAFAALIGKRLDRGATYVEALHTHPDDPDNNWWSPLSSRYTQLGLTALLRTGVARIQIAGSPPKLTPTITVPPEGIWLRRGLRSPALSESVTPYLQLLCTLDGSVDERRQAGHALTHIAVRGAGRHIREFITTPGHLRGKVVRGKHPGEYLIEYPDGRPTYTRLSATETPTLKCAAHARRPGRLETDLEKLIHAVVNEAADEGGLSWRLT